MSAPQNALGVRIVGEIDEGAAHGSFQSLRQMTEGDERLDRRRAQCVDDTETSVQMRMIGEQCGQDVRIDSSAVSFAFGYEMKSSFMRAGFYFAAEEGMAVAGPGEMKTDDTRARLRVRLVVDPGGVSQVSEREKTAVAADDDV